MLKLKRSILLKHLPAYSTNFSHIIILVLISLLWTNVASLSCWMLDHDSIHLELCDPLDKESEKEEKKSEEDKYNDTELAAWKTKADYSSHLALLRYSLYFQSLHHPEMPTPPPRFS